MALFALRPLATLGLLSSLSLLSGSRAESELCQYPPIDYEGYEYKYVDCTSDFEGHDAIEECCVVWTMRETWCGHQGTPVEEGVNLQLVLMDMVQKDTGGNPFDNYVEHGNWYGKFAWGTSAIPNQDVYQAWWMSWMKQNEDFTPAGFDFRVKTKGFGKDSIWARHGAPACGNEDR